MMTVNRILLDEHKLCLLSFENIFKRIEVQLLNDLNEYGLIKNDRIDLRNRDTKKFIYHNLIHTICDTVIRYKKQYKCDVAIVYDTIFTQESDICSFIDCTILHRQLSQCLKRIQSILPILILSSTDTIDKTYFTRGEGIEMALTIVHKYEKIQRNTTFSKITDFTDKYELTFLSENYFNKLTTKHLLI